ncbi:WD40/YVTN/BNR-like repeat-containing protein [Halomarina oriensis]|uniref:Glycosyl hydrolase n=1 Tax=Halomarina oriensis TaxID=671145 RepID=A0A6B0GNM8_9EURY|nr:hypothetical protein [Halomarina oriensis]MWG35561.1 hypothetical protein [Halomarina oriensis]
MTLYATLRTALLVVRDEREAPTVERRLADYDLECVCAHPDAPDTVLVGTFDDGLFRSTDGADSFERVAPEMESRVMSLAVNPHDPDEWWAGTEPSRVYHSTDAGVTWTENPGLTDLPSAEDWYFPPRPDTHHIRWLAVDPSDTDHLYVGIEAGALVQSHDRGETWADRVDGSRRDNHSLATHPDAPERVWSAAGDGYAESHDHGETWDYPQEGLGHRYVWSVAVDPGDPETVLVSAASGARSAHSLPAESYVYRRDGDGAWEQAMDGLPEPDGLIRAVLEPGEDGECFALTNRGVFRSTDFGGSWAALDVPWDESFESQTGRGLVAV